VSLTLRVDPIACEAHGFCAELFAERISLDDWGYPIIDPGPIDGRLEAHARRAVKACPTVALALVEAGPAASSRKDVRGSR